MKKLKLLWDFRGPDAQGIAEHHEIHLNEYAEAKGISSTIGTEKKADMYWTAWIIVIENDMPQVRDALRPHRGELA